MEWIKKIFGKSTGRRSYSGAKGGRLYNDWSKRILSGDSEIRNSITSLRSRSRELAMNNDYARRFLKKLVCNVIGHNGIKLQMQTGDTSLDKIIENEFETWGKKGSASICGRLSFVSAQQLFLETVARDGECLVYMHSGDGCNFALEFIEADHLDENLNKTLGGNNDSNASGNYINMGIERDKKGKAIYYHILKNHPASNQTYRIRDEKYRKIPSDKVIHGFVIDRPSQTRGVPWMHSAMTRLKMLSSYEEAELVAARVAAAKMGFFTSADGASYTGEMDIDGTLSMEAQPGSFEQLPSGVDIKMFDPQHPSGRFAEFEKSVLRGIASGLDVSYNSLANDLEGVNFSSIRHGALEDRDTWRLYQNWMIENFLNPVFDSWFLMAVTTGLIKIKMKDFQKINNYSWKPRGWAWIDPLKENQANKEAINAKIKTRSQIAAEQGGDIEEIFAQIADEEKMAKKYNINLNDNYE